MVFYDVTTKCKLAGLRTLKVSRAIVSAEPITCVTSSMTVRCLGFGDGCVDSSR